MTVRYGGPPIQRAKRKSPPAKAEGPTSLGRAGSGFFAGTMPRQTTTGVVKPYEYLTRVLSCLSNGYKLFIHALLHLGQNKPPLAINARGGLGLTLEMDRSRH